jgi:protocatechuate 3,4-dioxygenase beta subunit
MRSKRRDTLALLGAASVTALSGCGGTANGSETEDMPGAAGADGSGAAGAANSAGTSPGGASSAGTTQTNGGNAAGGEAMAEGGAGTGEAPECAAKQETTAGPFPNVSPLERRDVRANSTGGAPKPGAEVTLRIRVLDLDAGCAPIAGAVVDIWHCDAAGDYAGYAAFATVGEDFCRGYQLTGDDGVAEFLTIFPGSYAGRALHIHVSIQGTPSKLNANGSGQALADVFVAQLYFEADVAAEIFEAFPIYQQGAAITPNERDGIFDSGGSDLLVSMTQLPGESAYSGEVTIGVARSAIGM